jgi:hypothetical protein
MTADFVDGVLTLGFDRAIELGGIVPLGLAVLDATTATEWSGTAGITPIGTHAFAMVMLEQGEYLDPGVLLDAPTGAGVVAAEGALPWAGVEGLALPFLA